ncbi:hypothetical protein CC1G_13805 [Coprinopsis cinerea okayama7|uniref:Uncharacterized protein n=1 Tax=Coprinopsis cinerea (strain Okayama-7 / 130 / ATCC MYA-4618 / FGSC 9003) TaxID=240176 RepID=D6RKD4_COPC7|nr:hypothetical protein CC1G_13805 [Coprinopsis cinerea okayama7\|eukprot:XP_002912274.1 hypothetical protein CC1G_13805 [Coprinopsis cinerea okayama7\
MDRESWLPGYFSRNMERKNLGCFASADRSLECESFKQLLRVLQRNLLSSNRTMASFEMR